MQGGGEWGRGICRRVLCYFSKSLGSAKGPYPHPCLHALPQLHPHVYPHRYTAAHIHVHTTSARTHA